MPLKNFWYYYNDEDDGKGAKYDWYTLSGDIVRFNTEVSAPLRNLIANISYTQDLNGYSYPWPAGGGKNKFNGTFLQGYWAYANGAWVNSPNWITTEKIPCKASTSYTVSADAKMTRWQGFVWYDSNGDFISTDNLNSNVNIGLTKTSPSNAAYLIFNIAGYPNSTDTIAPSDVTHFQLEEGSASTAYSPYANICPISGWTGANVYHYGKNLCPDLSEEWVDGYVDANGTLVPPTEPTWAMTSPYIAAAANNKYTFSYRLSVAEPAQGYWCLISFFDANKQFIFRRARTTQCTLTETAPSDAAFIRLSFRTYHAVQNVQLELGSTASSYEPYNGQTVTIQLGQTVYGGTLDVTTGKLTVDRAYAVFDGSSDENWRMHGTIASWFYTDNAFTNAFTDASASNFSISNAYKQSPYGTVANIENGKFAIGYSSGSAVLRTVFKDTRYTTVQEWTNAVATNHIQLCYKLATPQTYQLTPTEVTALLGDNTIWADTGDVEVTYKDKAGKTITVSPLLSSVSPTAFRPALQIGKINFNDSDADDAESSSGESAQSEEKSENFADEIMNGEEIADNGNEPVSEEFLDEDVEVTKDVAETDSEVGTETLIEETAEEIAEETAVEETLVEANEPTKNLEVTGR